MLCCPILREARRAMPARAHLGAREQLDLPRLRSAHHGGCLVWPGDLRVGHHLSSVDRNPRHLSMGGSVTRIRRRAGRVVLGPSLRTSCFSGSWAASCFGLSQRSSASHRGLTTAKHPRSEIATTTATTSISTTVATAVTANSACTVLCRTLVALSGCVYKYLRRLSQVQQGRRPRPAV